MVDLSHLEADFAESQEKKAANFDPIPDGRYVAEVVGAELKNSKSTNAPMLEWTLAIVGGSFNGRRLWRRNMLASKANLGWLKSDLGKCGITLNKLNDLNERAPALIGLKLNITQKTVGQFANVYVDSLYDGSIAAAALGPEDDSSVPF